MALTPARTMPGVLELLPLDQIALQRMLDVIRRNYERFGFVPIETPAIEYSDVLLTKSGGETERQVYFVQSTGALDHPEKGVPGVPELALRFDLTVPLARYVAEHEHDLSFPFRRYQLQRVYRGERAQRGRFREFYQCDIDVIGKDALSIRYDADLPAVVDKRNGRPGLLFVQDAGGHRDRLVLGFAPTLAQRGPQLQRAVLAPTRQLGECGGHPARVRVLGLAGERRRRRQGRRGRWRGRCSAGDAARLDRNRGARPVGRAGRQRP